MAKILQGIGVEAISGTIGGTTFQKWRGLLIARGKPTPHNPMTERQTRIRAIVSTISRAWRDVLTEGQRTAWNQFAEVFPWFDVFGRSLSLRGISLFLKMNTVLLDHVKPMQITPPPAVVPPEFLGEEVDTPFGLGISTPTLVAGIITAQEPFLDVWVAGGFLTVEDVSDVNIALEMSTLALPQGRKAQRSDFRHVAYADDVATAEPPEGAGQIAVISLPGTTKNFTVRVQRYNKYGQYSVPRIYQKIALTSP